MLSPKFLLIATVNPIIVTEINIIRTLNEIPRKSAASSLIICVPAISSIMIPSKKNTKRPKVITFHTYPVDVSSIRSFAWVF